jgi:uncharacterized protein YjbJ (UPF0337 family)
MNKKELSGTADEVKGKVEKTVGKVTGNERTQAHGEAEEMKGKAKRGVGHVEKGVKDTVNDIERNTKEAARE